MQINVTQSFCRRDERGRLGAREETFAPVVDGGQAHAAGGVWPRKKPVAVNLDGSGQIESLTEQGQILFNRSRCGTAIGQIIDKRLDFAGGDFAQGAVAKTRADEFAVAVAVGLPASFGALRPREVVGSPKGVQGHGLAGGLRGHRGFLLALLGRRAAHLGQARRAEACADVLFDAAEDCVGLFGVPALAGPAESFFTQSAVDAATHHIVAIRLATVPTGGVLAVSDARVLGAVPRFHSTTIVPLILGVKLVTGDRAKEQGTDGTGDAGLIGTHKKTESPWVARTFGLYRTSIILMVVPEVCSILHG